VGRTYKTEAVVLRSIRYAEADRILHLYTSDRGRVGAIAKGIRKTTSRVGGRLEPLGHVELVLHQGSGELHTVTGVELVRPHSATRDDPYRLSVGLVGAEAMLRLFTEQEANEQAFAALTRFLDVLDDTPAGGPEVPRSSGRASPALPATHPATVLRPDLDPLGLAFQLKLLWLSGYHPHLGSCAECGSEGPLVGYSARAGGTVCRTCSAGALALSEAGFAGIVALLRSSLADARSAGLSERAARDVLAVITASYEEHGGFRLRTLRAG
jgi:DNA repair protein RecO (recombination protein O)